MAFPDHLDPAEARIINRLIKTILAAGYEIDVRDAYGDSSEEVERMTSKAKIQAEVAATGETLFDLYDTKGTPLGWILLVHGNGCDVISDYSDKPLIDALQQPAQDLAETLE